MDQDGSSDTMAFPRPLMNYIGIVVFVFSDYNKSKFKIQILVVAKS